MCEVIFLKQKYNEKDIFYVKRTKKLYSRFYVKLRKGEVGFKIPRDIK